MSSSQLTNSIIFRRGRSTTNQIYNIYHKTSIRSIPSCPHRISELDCPHGMWVTWLHRLGRVGFWSDPGRVLVGQPVARCWLGKSRENLGTRSDNYWEHFETNTNIGKTMELLLKEPHVYLENLGPHQIVIDGRDQWMRGEDFRDSPLKLAESWLNHLKNPDVCW